MKLLPPPGAFARRRFVLAVLLVLVACAAGLGLWVRRKHNEPDPVYVAVAVPLSGPQALQGQNVVKAVELSFREANKAGGIDGRPLKVLVADDEGRPSVAADRAREIAEGPALAVIGHMVSATTQEAGPVYRKAHLATVAGTANADQLAKDNPNFFCVIFNTTAEGRNLAAYARRVLGHQTASIIATDETFGKAVADAFCAAFTRAGGEVRHRWTYDRRISRREASIDAIARGLKEDQKPGVVLLFVSPSTSARDVVVQLRDRGVHPPFLGGTNLGSGAFSELFDDFDHEASQPGYYTDGIYAATPFLYDSAGSRAQEFFEAYKQAYRAEPDSRAAKFYDAARVVVAALRRADVANRQESRDEDRRNVSEQLAGLNRPERALPGASGPLYFDEDHTQPQPVRVGRFLRGKFVSAPTQFAAVLNPGLVDLKKEMEADNVFLLGKQPVWKQRVVYTGIDFNRVSRVDQARGTFSADFYLWFRYAGGDEVTQVEFPSAVGTVFNAKAPLVAQNTAAMNYRLYRVQGEFKNAFDFRDYPFDRQTLVLQLQNARLPRDQVVYAVDAFGLRLPRPERTGDEAFKSLAQWSFRGMRYFQDALTSHSTRGHPGALFAATEIEYSGFNAVAVLQRRTTIFLIKILLPLVMLVLVVYVTLFFPVSLTKERLTIAISGLLASAVLLTGINSQLSEASYTTAIEYGFYVFFGLCLFCIITGLSLERMRAAHWNVTVHRLEILSRVLYMAVVLFTMAVYVVLYGVA
jgi:branched-chain amino acid transport system substrate-binding protein